MRFSLSVVSSACVLAVLLSSVPARSSQTQPIVLEQYSRCEGFHDALRYQASLLACNQAASALDRMAATYNNPWSIYVKKAEAMEIAALDCVALKKHREALRWAIGAHRLAFYVYNTYKLDPDDYSSINDLITRLTRIESYERIAISRS